MLTSYMPTYVTETMPTMQGGRSVSAGTSPWLQIVVMVVALLTIPLLGVLSDRVGRKPIVWVGTVGLVVLALPAVLLVRFSATMPSTLPSLSRPRCAAGRSRSR